MKKITFIKTLLVLCFILSSLDANEFSDDKNANKTSVVEEELYDIINFGGGPTGITNACLVKALNPSIKIAVLDKRKYTTRDFGLTLNADSMDRVLLTITQADQTNPTVQQLKSIYEKWKAQSIVKTSEIEDTLSDIATQLGIDVLRGPNYGVVDTKDLKTGLIIESAKNKFIRLMQGQYEENNESEQKLAKLLSNASIIVGADGSHSVVRDVIGGQKTDITPLHWTIQLKYQIKNSVKPVNGIQTTSTWITEEYPVIHQMAKTTANPYKPVTDQFFVPKEIYDALIINDGERTKGTSTDPWTIFEIEQMEKSNPKISKIYNQMIRELARAEKLQGNPKAAKVSVLPIGLYRSDIVYKEINGKICILAGDAYAGLALQRGANNGQKAAAMLAEAISYYLAGNDQAIEQYSADVKEMTLYEMEKVELRSDTLTATDKALAPIRPFLRTIGNLSKIRKPVQSNAVEWSQPIPNQCLSSKFNVFNLKFWGYRGLA
ncbi:MAG: hypothetical protein Q8K60_02390 [Parachlamydiaceae bacterium]|nr:hypothetical protein [Parachlamydiaceae bacterium]